MSKGAATENALGSMHSLLARVFTQTLKKYEKTLSALDAIDMESVEEEFLITLISEIGEPNPAMLSAAAKFLKDNDVGMDSEELEELDSTARRLEESRKRRASSGLHLKAVPHVEAV